jgi:hypothetical protein
MSIKPLTETQKTRMVNNVVKACKNIESLNKTGYDFINLASGFIAHYNLNGFIEHYKHYSLKDDIIRNANQNQWNNFRQGEQNYDYYMSKKDVYNQILAKI